MNFPFIKRSIHQEMLDKHRELTLEYQNFRRRNAEIRETAYQSGRADAALEFLPVYDNLLLALEQPCADEAYVTGIRMTLKSLQKALKSLGIMEIPALGQPFDPAVHEALEHTQDDAVGENIVVKVARTGFRQDSQVLRHALVIVAN